MQNKNILTLGLLYLLVGVNINCVSNKYLNTFKNIALTGGSFYLGKVYNEYYNSLNKHSLSNNNKHSSNNKDIIRLYYVEKFLNKNYKYTDINKNFILSEHWDGAYSISLLYLLLNIGNEEKINQVLDTVDNWFGLDAIANNGFYLESPKLISERKNYSRLAEWHTDLFYCIEKEIEDSRLVDSIDISYLELSYDLYKKKRINRETFARLIKYIETNSNEDYSSIINKLEKNPSYLNNEELLNLLDNETSRTDTWIDITDSILSIKNEPI